MAYKKGKYVFTWKIENFSLCNLKHNERMESPNFKAETIGGSEWFLSIYPNGYATKLHLSCFLHRVKNDDDEENDFCFELISTEGEILNVLTCKKNRITEEGMGVYEFFALEKLNEKMKNWKSDILTLRCTLIGDFVLMNNPAQESIAWTKVGVDRCCFKWNIDIPDHVSWVRNKNIFMSEKSQLSITLSSPIDNIEICIYNRNEDDDSDTKLVYSKISLISLKGKEIISQSAKHLFDEDNKDSLNYHWQFPNFLSKNYLQIKAHDIMWNDLFTLRCEICASTGEILSEIKTVKYKDSMAVKEYLNDSISALQEDLRNMLKTNKSIDVKLQVENQIIPANKFILRARSPVFSTIFDQEDKIENQTGIVKIQDLDAETVKLLLEFIYTGSVNDLEFENAKKLLVAADKYRIPSLVKNCSALLISVLSKENVCEVCALADMINLSPLKLSALEYIKKNSSIVILSDMWSDWMVKNVNLANEILFNLTRDFLQ